MCSHSTSDRCAHENNKKFTQPSEGFSCSCRCFYGCDWYFNLITIWLQIIRLKMDTWLVFFHDLPQQIVYLLSNPCFYILFSHTFKFGICRYIHVSWSSSGSFVWTALPLSAVSSVLTHSFVHFIILLIRTFHWGGQEWELMCKVGTQVRTIIEL